MTEPVLSVARSYLALGLCDLDGDEHTSAVILDDLGLGAAVAPEKVEKAAKRKGAAAKGLAKKHPV